LCATEQELQVHLNNSKIQKVVFAVEPRQLALNVSLVVFCHNSIDFELLMMQICEIRGGVQRFDLIACTWLQQLYINHCDMRQLPSAIALLTDLLELDLTYNQFTSIDAIDFTRTSKLTFLHVTLICLC
jgi:hypothetical protein